jgi:hypothetical protein
MSRRIIIETAERDAKLYKSNGQLLLYIAKVVVNSDTVTMTPLRGITESDQRHRHGPPSKIACGR